MEHEVFTLADYLKNLRMGLSKFSEKGKAPSMRETAEEIGINHSYLARLESGEKKNASGVCLQQIVGYYSKYYQDVTLELLTSLCEKTNLESNSIEKVNVRLPRQKFNIDVINKLLEMSKTMNHSSILKTIQFLEIPKKDKLLFFEVFVLVQSLANDNKTEDTVNDISKVS